MIKGLTENEMKNLRTQSDETNEEEVIHLFTKITLATPGRILSHNVFLSKYKKYNKMLTLMSRKIQGKDINEFKYVVDIDKYKYINYLNNNHCICKTTNPGWPNNLVNWVNSILNNINPEDNVEIYIPTCDEVLKLLDEHEIYYIKYFTDSDDEYVYSSECPNAIHRYRSKMYKFGLDIGYKVYSIIKDVQDRYICDLYDDYFNLSYLSDLLSPSYPSIIPTIAKFPPSWDKASSLIIDPYAKNAIPLNSTDNNFEKVDQDGWRGICTHRNPTTGESALNLDGDNYYKCSICGKRFRLVETSSAEAENSINNILDMLYRAKTIYLD